MTLPKLIAELEEALKAATPEPWRALTYENSAYVKGPDVIVHKLVNDPSDDGPCGEGGHTKQTIARWHADARLMALMRNSLPTLIEALKWQGEAKDKPIWGVWVDYNLAPPGSYACLVSSFVNGEWSDPEARWMPAQGRPRLQGQIRVMPHLMPNDPLTAHKEKSDV